MKKLKANPVSFNLIKQKSEFWIYTSLSESFFNQNKKLQESHTLIQLVLIGITLTKPNSILRFQFKDEINSNKPKSSPNIKNTNANFENALGFKPYLASLAEGAVQSVASLVTPIVHMNRVIVTPVSSTECAVVSFGTLPRCGGACKFQINTNSEKDNIRYQCTGIK